MKLNLKDKLKSLGRALLNSTSAIPMVLLNVGIITVIALMALKLPESYDKHIRKSVGDKVYMIKDSPMSGGGTGFAITAPSGQTYILTNDHVCEVSSDGVTVLVESSEKSLRRKIVAKDPNSDLCLIEGIPGEKGLSLGSEPLIGDHVAVVGHPLLMPKHISKGEYFGVENVSFIQGPISYFSPITGEEVFIKPIDGGIDPADCRLNKHRQEVGAEDFFFFKIYVKYCTVNVKNAYTTSVIIHPGNSGSPVVNFWGNVIAVAFAGDETNWGRMVSLSDVKRFLKNY